MKNAVLWAVLTGALPCVTGCGGGGGSGGMAGMGGDGGGEVGGSGGDTSGTGGAGGSGATGGSGGTGGGAEPLAPTMESAEPLAGALHVTWKNNTPNCDKIELDRKKDDGAYATEYTLNGMATSQHDTEATTPGTYCYKARCFLGANTSPDSNEICGPP